MSRRSRSGTIAFRPRARLLKLIGEELISDDVVAVSELVKNAHDADALTVTVSFRGVTGPEGEIEVRDDGCGMDLDTLLGRWMEPAASAKVGQNGMVTARGRRVLGEKGVGRFAADKLARKLEVISRSSGSPDEVHAFVDWDLFADGKLMLEEVENRWELRPPRAIPRHGTHLHLTGLRSVWTERMFRRLSIRLARLLSPFGERDRFGISIESDEFPEYSGELRSDILDRAPYRIEARFEGSDTVSLTIGSRSTQIRWNGQGELTCGPVGIRLLAFDLEGEALARIGPRMEVRAWLKEWTGVSIYRDGFRVWPYGEPHDDWLRLDQRRVNNPVGHLSNNQVIGFIDIGRDANPELIDQTNREGLMNNRALEDLRRLVYFVLQILEAERQSIRHPVKRSLPSLNGHTNDGATVTAELERLAESAAPEIGRELRRIGQKIEEQFSRERMSHDRLVDGYAGLAAVGQMTALMLPAVPRDVERLREDLEALRKAVAGAGLSQHARMFDRLVGGLESITERVGLLHVAAGSGDRRRAIDLSAELEAFRKLTAHILESQGVKLEMECPQGEVIRTEMRPENFHCLLQVLTSNSLDWLRGKVGPRIRVTVTGLPDGCEIIFSDNGPGVAPEISHCIFNPLFSCKEGGRGMGLTIARQLVEAHGGQIHLILDGRRRGANFRIVLPRKRSRATIYDR